MITFRDLATAGRAGAPAPSVRRRKSSLFRSPVLAILAVVSGTMLGFSAFVIYFDHSAQGLDRNALSIATNASPAIQHLASARGELQRLQVDAISAIQLLTQGITPDTTVFGAVSTRFHDDLAAYRSLPFYSGEDTRYEAIETAVRRLDAQLASFLDLLDAHDAKGAAALLNSGLFAASSKADEAIQAAEDFNADQQHKLGIAIPSLRSSASLRGELLAAATAGSGLLLMALIVQAARRQARRLDEQAALAEQKAEASSAFSVRLEAMGGATVRIANAITGDGKLQKILQIVADEARIVARADFCSLGCGTDPTVIFSPWVYSGLSPEAAKAIGQRPRPVGSLGEVARKGRPLRVPDLMNHSVFRGLPDNHPEIGPFLGVPLLHEDRNVGTLYLGRAVGGPPFTEDDERAVSLLAAYVGVAIDNARLYSQAQAATRAREELLAVVSHDLKNPLNSIHVTTELLRWRTGKENAAAIAARIDRSVGRMLRLVDELLDSAQIEAGLLRVQGRSESVASLVEEALEMSSVTAAERNIALAHRGPCSSSIVHCERELLLRVFANLVSNAIKFSSGGGSVSILTEDGDGQVRISVQDTGSGIPSHELPYIFDRYWQQKHRDHRGTGLGLYIAKGIVEAHSGKIWAESTVGVGTTVHFTLPVARTLEA